MLSPVNTAMNKTHKMPVFMSLLSSRGNRQETNSRRSYADMYYGEKNKAGRGNGERY